MSIESLDIDNCPVCGISITSPFFDGGTQPLTTIGWYPSEEAAKNLTKYSLRYVQCLQCTHIWNKDFNYKDIPYTDTPNRMFNLGSSWQEYMDEMHALLQKYLPKNPTVIDIGCGDGHFVKNLSTKLNDAGRFIGFDPTNSQDSGKGIEFYPDYFNPLVDIKSLSPDLLVMRHVIEHLEDPSIFIKQLQLAAIHSNKKILFFAEVPCIDKAIESNRLTDFFYEHPSQFTSQSFEFLMKQGGEILAISRAYKCEVIYALIELQLNASSLEIADSSRKFNTNSKKKQCAAKEQLELISKSESVAIWGGKGKAAAFMNFYNADNINFPIVVDSDTSKVGTHVSGTGQKIQHYDILKTHPVDAIVIPSQWRAADIVAFIIKENIPFKKILLEHDGNIISYFDEKNPYA